MLTAAIHAAAAKVSAPLPHGFADEPLGLARWGEQIDVRVIAAGDDASVDGSPDTPASPSRSSRAVANYVAKYATKSTDERVCSTDD